MEVNIRAPSQYSHTRIFSETLAEETVFLFAEWLGAHQLQCSIAFPEIIVPITVALRKIIKGSKGGKEVGMVKQLIEHAEEGGKWIQSKRRNVKFGPGNRKEVMRWEDSLKVEDSPMGKWLKVLRKQREKRKQLVEKV
jgi:nucleolar complex protein 2